MLFDTIANNVGTSGATTAGSTVCSLVSTPITSSDSIVYNNGGSQVGGSPNCLWTYSDIGPDTSGGSGTGMINSDPLFINAAQNDFRIGSGSPCVDAADPVGDARGDFFGTTRPQGAHDDIGADEFVP